jgi:L-threonylcarbamoyladenylate synthase
MAEIIGISSIRPEEVASRIKQGRVFVYPTDTVYGLGCDATNGESVRRIFEIKRRPPDKPLSVAFSGVDELLGYINADEGQKAMLRKKLPGPYTFIVNNKSIPRFVTGGGGTLGVRVPNYSPLLNIIKKAGAPIITTSANLSGCPAPGNIHEIDPRILQGADFVLDGGSIGSGKPSEVIDLTTGERLR